VKELFEHLTQYWTVTDRRTNRQMTMNRLIWSNVLPHFTVKIHQLRPKILLYLDVFDFHRKSSSEEWKHHFFNRFLAQ